MCSAIAKFAKIAMVFIMKGVDSLRIEPKYFAPLGRIFTPIVLSSIAEKGHSPYLTEVCYNSGLIKYIDPEMRLSQFFDWVYSFLLKNYKNEYIYKNAITQKILLGTHSLNTSHLLTEFRVGRCKADAVILNGTSTVYEIKSEYDTFDRLSKQIDAYLQVFEHINVITSTSQIPELRKNLPSEVGIMALTDRNTISTVRHSISNLDNICLNTLFDSLRKSEYTKVINDYYGSIPDIPNTQIYSECKRLFMAMPKDKAHSLAVQSLKERRNIKFLKVFLDKAPTSLSAYAISISNEKSRLQALIQRLPDNVATILK